MADAIAAATREGAILVDPADLPSVVDPNADKNVLLFDTCSGIDNGKGKDANCSSVLKYGMKRDFNAYLASLGASAPVKSLTELRIFNLTHLKANAIRYGQSNLDISDELDYGRTAQSTKRIAPRTWRSPASTAWRRRSKTTGSTRCSFQGGTSQGWRRVPAFLKSWCRSVWWRRPAGAVRIHFRRGSRRGRPPTPPRLSERHAASLA